MSSVERERVRERERERERKREREGERDRLQSTTKAGSYDGMEQGTLTEGED